METRIKLTVFLLGIGVILAFIPEQKSLRFRLNPHELVTKALDEHNFFTADQVARFINSEDSTIQLIDVRVSDEFKKSSLPGAINIPLKDLLNPDWEGWINQKKMKVIYYSGTNFEASMAWTFATGLGYNGSFVMKGGLDEWNKTIMMSQFEGNTITARENALFENRFRARKLFNEMNSLPDSLKVKYLETKRLKRERLDGGC